MSVLDDLVCSVRTETVDSPVQEVLIGLYWTAVSSQGVGLATTLNVPTCCFAEDVSGVGDLQHRSAHELVGFLRSTHPLEISIGMAAINSLITVSERDAVELNARDLLIRRGHRRNVALIGHFSFAEALRKEAAKLWVFELQPTPGDLPAEAAPEFLPQAEVVGLTATTLMNGTFEELSRLFSPEALVMMLGPSTPLSRVLFDHRVDVLSGTQVIDPVMVLRYVGQGSSLHHNVTGIQRITIARDRSVVMD
jgi:uncharacterized protein (DUF4213/DUF364 family)